MKPTPYFTFVGCPKQLKLGILLALLFINAAFVMAAGESGYVLDGDKAYWENAYGQINVSRFVTNTITKVGSEWYYVIPTNLTWFGAPTSIDVAFVFDVPVSGGLDTGTYSEVEDENGTMRGNVAWTDKTSLIQHEQYSGRHYYTVKNIPVSTGQLIRARLRITAASVTEQLKYDFLSKLTADSVSEAISTGRYVALDPIVAVAECSAESENLPNYPCENTYDGAYAALTDCWISDTQINSWVSLNLGGTHNISNVTVISGVTADYHTTLFNISLSNDTTDGTDGTWALFTPNYESPQTAYYNITHNESTSARTISAKWIRVSAQNSDEGNAWPTVCEIVVSNYTAAPPVYPTFTTVNTNGTNTTVTGDSVNWTATIDISGANLHTCWFASNDGGTYANLSVVECSEPFVFSVNRTITSITGQVCGYFGANTSDSLQTTSSESCFTLQGVDDIINCSGQPGNVSLNISFFDEDFPSTNLAASIEIAFELWNANNTQNYINRTYSINGSDSYAFCIVPNTASVIADIYLKHIAGITNRYYMTNVNLTNTTSFVQAYNFPSDVGKSTLKITVRDILSYQPLANITASLMRNYVGDGVWRVVQMDRTDDYGTLIFNIIEQSQDYKIVLYDQNGNVLRQTDSMKFVCTSGLCEITMVTAEYASTTQVPAPGTSITFNNVTSIVTVAWNDASGVTQSVRRIASKQLVTGVVTICDSITIAASGSVDCNLSAYSGDVLVQVLVNGEPSLSQWVRVSAPGLSAQVGDREGAVWTAGAVIIAVGFGLWSPVAALISVTFILIAFAFLGVFSPLTTTVVITFAIVSAAIGVVVKK